MILKMQFHLPVSLLNAFGIITWLWYLKTSKHSQSKFLI